MIITKKVKIQIFKTTKNKNYYKNLGYFIDNSTNVIHVNTSDLPKSSTIKVSVECDICKKEKIVEYRQYLINIKKYGYFSCFGKCSKNKIKNTQLKKYGDENYNNREKCKKTNLTKFGVENPFQNKEIKMKSKKTKLEKYSDENYNNVDKSKETCLEKYDDENYRNIEKMRKTNLEKYGVSCTIHNKEINEKIIKSNIEKYGCSIPTQNDDVKEKLMVTNIKKYGYRNPLQNNDILQKSKHTMISRYGVEHSMQNLVSFNKQQLSGKLLKFHEDSKLYYRGTYEKDFLNFCINNNIMVENIRGFEYNYYNKKKIYFPDFYLQKYNLVIEVKSDYYYEKYLEKNIKKQQCVLQSGFNFLFIINKNYTELLDFIKN